MCFMLLATWVERSVNSMWIWHIICQINGAELNVVDVVHMVMVPHVFPCIYVVACTISDSKNDSTFPSCANEKSISRKYTSYDARNIQLTSPVLMYYYYSIALFPRNPPLSDIRLVHQKRLHTSWKFISLRRTNEIRKIVMENQNQDKLSFSKFKSCPLIYGLRYARVMGLMLFSKMINTKSRGTLLLAVDYCYFDST